MLWEGVESVQEFETRLQKGINFYYNKYKVDLTA